MGPMVLLSIENPRRYGRAALMPLLGVFLLFTLFVCERAGSWIYQLQHLTPEPLVTNRPGDNTTGLPKESAVAAEKPPKDLVAYLSDLPEFGVKGGPWPFSKKGNRGDGGGR